MCSIGLYPAKNDVPVMAFSSTLLVHVCVCRFKMDQSYSRLEYLTTQICFLQGLLNWLAASAIEIFIPQKGEAKSSLLMNKCLVSWLFSLIVWMLAFYNHHLSFYSDYFSMLRRWFALLARDYIFPSSFRPLSLIYIPSFIFSIYQTWKAFRSEPDGDDEPEPAISTD